MVLVLCVVMLVALATAQDLAAEERKTGWSKGFNLGTGWFLDGYLGTGFSGRAFVEYAPYIPEIGLKLTGGYLRFVDTVTVGKGTFQSSEEVVSDNWYVTGGMAYRFSRGKVVPFVTGNLGMYRYRKEKAETGLGPIIDGEQTSPYSVVTMHEGYAFGINGGGGVEFFLSPKTSLSVESVAHFTFGGECDQIIDVTAMFRFLP
jgi:hypothetical protein